MQIEILIKAAEIAEISLQQQDQADEIFLRIQQLDPTNPDALKRSANALYKNEQWSDLLDLYRDHGDIFRDGTRATVDMLIQMSEAAQALSDWDTVVTASTEVLEMVPTHLFSLQALSASLQELGHTSEAVDIDTRLLDVISAQGNKESLAEVCLRLGHSNLVLEEWSTALKYFQKSRIYAPTDSRSLKGIIECSWQKGEYSRVAQLCSTLVKNATDEQDVILGYLWRGFTLDAKLQWQELAEQHYWRVLEYDQNHYATLIYLSGISFQKSKYKSMLGQLSQVWGREGHADNLNQLVAVGRYIAATELEEDTIKEEMVSWLEANDISVTENVGEEWSSQLKERLFGI